MSARKTKAVNDPAWVDFTTGLGILRMSIAALDDSVDSIETKLALAVALEKFEEAYDVVAFDRRTSR